MADAVNVAVALGSNLGDREAHLAHAVRRLETILRDLRRSAWVETVPVGVAGKQGPFLNGAVTGRTTVAPREFLEMLLDVERERDRLRPFPRAPRTLDLDLILYGSAVIDEPGLVVPHPRFRERRFVLEPLAEIAGDWVDPVSGGSISALLRALPPDPA